MSELERIILGNDAEVRDEGGATFVEGKVKSVSAKGMMFTIPSWDGGKYEYGPAPYPRMGTLTTEQTAVGDHGTHAHDLKFDPDQPVAGSRCLILFPTGTQTDPWVIGWWPA